MDTPLALSELANWYYYTADLAREDDELLPESFWESDEGIRVMLTRAFTSSDCGDFAVMLHEMTGYPLMNLLGPDGFPIHTFARTPDGLALDVLGVSTDADVARRYGFEGNTPPTTAITPDQACGYLPSDEWTDDGFDERAVRLSAIIRQLPWAPFNTPEFKAMTHRPLAGVDFPQPEEMDEPATETQARPSIRP